jgi:hypothetical protein
MATTAGFTAATTAAISGSSWLMLLVVGSVHVGLIAAVAVGAVAVAVGVVPVIVTQPVTGISVSATMRANVINIAFKFNLFISFFLL